MSSAVVLDVLAERDRHDRDRSAHSLEPERADPLLGGEGQRPDVAVPLEAFPAEQLAQVPDEVLHRVGQLEREEARGFEEPLEVIVGTEDEELLFLLVPETAQPSEATRAVLEGVRHDADLRLPVRNDAPVEERELGQRCRRAHARPLLLSAPAPISPLISPL